MDQEDENLKMAIKMSLSPQEPKRSKPQEDDLEGERGGESSEARSQRMRRELMAAAAERRMKAAATVAAVKSPSPSPPAVVKKTEKAAFLPSAVVVGEKAAAGPSSGGGEVSGFVGEELSSKEAEQLFSMIFGSDVSKDILAQWTNQGIRFSSDAETCMGLVQHEGGPCGVLAAIQAFVLKHLLFSPDDLDDNMGNRPTQRSRMRRVSSTFASEGDFCAVTEDEKIKALVHAMVEILFMCGSDDKAVISTLNIVSNWSEHGGLDNKRDEKIGKALEGFVLESGLDLQKVVRVNIYTSRREACTYLKSMFPIFQSRMGALLFLISALLSRGLEAVQCDRDDPTIPLVTAPFGHALQEIVNLLLCGQAVPNVFDDRMDLGSGMFLKGVPRNVEVGFLTLLEALFYCKVGQYLKCPKWPIWVIGSESHYTVLFALDNTVQDENELEKRKSFIRRTFDALDQSGGGGFISGEGFHQVLRDADISLPAEKLNELCSSGFVVWSEFWQVLLNLDKSLGGLQDSTGSLGKKEFDLYHFNGIAKSVMNGSQVVEGENPIQRPKLTKLRVLVPPEWNPEEYMTNAGSNFGNDPTGAVEVDEPKHSLRAPLVDCIRTRWPLANCSWEGDSPSIV